MRELDYDPKWRYGLIFVGVAGLICLFFLNGGGNDIQTMRIPLRTNLTLVAKRPGMYNYYEGIPDGTIIPVSTTVPANGPSSAIMMMAVADIKTPDGRSVIANRTQFTGHVDVDKDGDVVLSQLAVIDPFRGPLPFSAYIESDTKPFVRTLGYWESLSRKF